MYKSYQINRSGIKDEAQNKDYFINIDLQSEAVSIPIEWPTDIDASKQLHTLAQRNHYYQLVTEL